VTNNGTVVGGSTGDGIQAQTSAGNGVVYVDVQNSVQGGIGILAGSTGGTGTTTILDTTPAWFVTGTTGDGIQVINGAGAATVGLGTGSRFNAPVTGHTNGIDMTGLGALSTYTSQNVTAGVGAPTVGAIGWGITDRSTGAGGAVTVDVIGGTITGVGATGAGNAKGGIQALSTNANAVSVTNNDFITATTGVFSQGIDAESSGTGNVTVLSGNVVSGLSITAGGTGIYAASAGGNIVVGGAGGITSSFLGMNGLGSAGIQTVETGNGATTVTTTEVAGAGADMSTLANADFGIESSNTGIGAITITSASAIGSSAPGGGVNSAGIFATESNALNTGGINITNTGAIWVDNVDPVGVVPSTYGIYGFNAGTGTVQLTNSGVIDPAGYGIYMKGGGNAISATSANVTGGVGIHTESTGNTPFTATTTVTGTAAITGTTGNGIENLGSGGANVVVNDTSTGAILGQTNGVFTSVTGAGTTNITTTGTVTGTTADGIDATTTGAGAVTIATGPGLVKGATNGIVGTSSGGATISVTTGGTTTGTGATGITATSAGGNGNVTVVTSGPVNAGTTGVLTSAAGTGVTNVTTTAGLITAAAGSGINSTGANGFITITSGPINATGGDGIDATGVVTVATDGGITINDDGLIAGTANNGIVAKETGSVLSGAITVNQNADIGTSADGIGTGANAAAGIAALVTNAGNAANITVNAAANIYVQTSTVTPTYGIEVSSLGAGNGTVNNTNATAKVIDPASYGIFDSVGGNASVNTNSTITAGTGISATTTGAATSALVTVTANGASPQITGNVGIAGGDGNAIEVFATNVGSTSTATANVGAPVLSTGAEGILVKTAGSGAAQATVTGGLGSTVTSVASGLNASNAIEVDSTGGGNVGVNTAAAGNVSGATSGVVTSVTGGNGTTTVNTQTSTNAAFLASVTGNAGDGVHASTTGSGAMLITTGIVTGSGAAGNTSSGILANSTGGSAITVSTIGSITGDLTGNAAGTGAAGIKATTSTGNGNVSVTVAAPTNASSAVRGGNYGIFASSAGTGATTVTAGGAGANLTPVTATGAVTDNGTGPVAISATGGTGGATLTKANGVVVTTYSNVTAAAGRAIVTNSGNNAAITINDDTIGVTLNQTVVQGLGDTTHAVIDVTAVTGATTTINNNGLVESIHGPAFASYGDLAIKGTTGAVTVNNNATGTLLGRVNFSGLTTTNGVTINNAGTWHTTGADTLSPTGNDAITNTGVIDTAANAAATSIAFGTGTNTFGNSAGAFLVAGEAPLAGTAAAPAVTTISGTVAFTNNGTIVLGGSTAGSDGKIDAVLLASGTTLGGTTGLIDLDANLWSDIQSASNCTTTVLNAADCVVIAGSTGTNAIKVTDTLTHALGAYNPTGITIVVGSSAASTFSLSPGSTWFNPGGTNQFGGATNVLAKPGLFFYSLEYFAADKTERLIGVPEAPAFEFAALGGAADDLWYATTQTWFDRQADLRDGIDGKGLGSGPGIWMKMIGDWSNRNHTTVFTPPGGTQSFTYNTSYDQDSAAIVGGIDLLNITQKDQAWVLGVDGGDVDSNVNFRASPDRAHLTGANIGGYATFVGGGLYIDGTVSANLLDMKVSLPGLQTTPNPWTATDNVKSIGGKVEAGYQMALGDMLFWEPLGVISYVNTSFSNLAIPGGTQQLGDTDSFRGSLGARVGATTSFQYYKVKLSLTGRVWDEFSDNNLSTLIVPSGPNFTNTDSLKGIFGEISGQANLFSTNTGFSAFVNGGVKFKSSYTDANVTLGARYQF